MPGHISEHFLWDEFTFTTQRDPGTGLLLANEPGPEEGARLVYTADGMDRVRAECGDRPVVVHSAYRSPQVNAQVGGSPTSQHMRGEACDFHVLGLSVPETFEIIRRSALEYDQLIEEAASWVHVSFTRNSPRRQALTMRVVNGRAKYEVIT